VPIAPGTKLGPYLVQEYVGQGAMGVVYRAYHAQLERVGAVKVLQGLSPDPDSVARFRREAQAIAHMRHPNIVNVFDFGEFEGTPYMIVEFVEGGSLSNVVKDGPLERKAMLDYLHGIADALDYAHSRGIVHRDVKPANVLLGSDNTPILADFGLAKLLESSSIKSLTGATTGTPAYMAPEQVTGSQVGPAADRYSLAVMAYEMLTGFLPFDQGGILEVLYAQVHRVPDPPSTRSARLGPRVDAVVMRGLAKDPNARWESCAAFVDALEAALSARSSSATKRTVVFAPPMPAVTPTRAAAPSIDATTIASAPALPGPDPVIARHPPRVRSRRGLLYAGLAAVVLILVLLLGTAAYFIASQPTTLSVSQSTVAPGDSIVVMASHLPQNQAGNIELHSLLRTYPFRADGNGNVRGTIFLPSDIDPGDHLLRICWSGACHAETTLHVIASVAIASPSASPSPSPTPSRSPSTSPTPAGPVITISNYYVKVTSGTETVAGLHFPPGTIATITFLQASTSTNKVMGTPLVSSNGSFSKSFIIPSSARPGAASVRACDGSCVFATIDVTT
jgi:serine/threonine protein kinase